MDVTVRDLAYLANGLGYGWCNGCRTKYIGIDFRRDGEKWEADTTKPCDGFKADQRLSISYGDWSFAQKDIQFGTPVINSMVPYVFDSGVLKNDHDEPTESKLSTVITEVRSVEHTITSSVDIGFGAGVEIKYCPSSAVGGVGFAASYKFSYQNTRTQTDEEGNKQENKFEIQVSKQLPPHTGSKYKIVVTKQRTTVPYTATIIAKFSVQLDGFLRWGGGKNGDSTNYHVEHRGSDSRPSFAYKMGDANTPFYEALKKASERNLHPWQWHAMKQKYPSAQTTIDSLIDEKFYEFTLTGQFEDIVGNHVEVSKLAARFYGCINLWMHTTYPVQRKVVAEEREVKR